MAFATPPGVLDYTEADKIVRQHANSLASGVSRVSQTLPLLESLGRVLAEPVRADRDQPPFPRSTRDGFACRAADLLAGRPLKIVGHIRAGEAHPQGKTEVSGGEAIEIMTGAPVPQGADCVAMVEHVEHIRDTIVGSANTPVSPGANIVSRAAEIASGDIVLPAGTRLTAAQIAAAASCGRSALRVFSRPRVAIIATGDELAPLDEHLLPHQIHDSNSYSLAAQVLAARAEPARLGIARDHRQHLGDLIRDALGCDLLLLTGGVSVGKYDLVEEVLLSLGAEFFFTGVRIQPGKPVVFGQFTAEHERKYFFGLPGNPVSTMVTFSLFAEPLLRGLAGETPAGPRFLQAKLASACQGKSGLTRFLPALLNSFPGQDILEPTVAPVPWHGSGDLASTSRANCFLVVPPARGSLNAGETVTVLL